MGSSTHAIRPETASGSQSRIETPFALGNKMTAEVAHLQARPTVSLPVSLQWLMLRRRVITKLKRGLYHRVARYGLCRDLALPLEKPSAKIPIAVRPLQVADLTYLLSRNTEDIDERLEIASRIAFVEKGARGGFVAIDTRNNTPCYTQWLLGARNNDFIRTLGGFPELEQHQALLENAYTPPAYRGLGIMSEAMALIAEHAGDLGARHVLTFVAIDNIASLKGCRRAGFYPDLLHHRTGLAFAMIRWDRFEKLPDGDPRRNAKF